MGTEERTITESSISNVPVLLIANGPAALSKEMGKAIDAFDGIVVRFNNYKTKGFEKYIGTRTDCWITTSIYPPVEESHKYRYFLTQRKDELTLRTVENTKSFLIDKSIWSEMPFYPPSSGALITHLFLKNNCKVHLCGFDFLCNRRNHHYNGDTQPRGEDHKSLDEWYYFNELHEQGKVYWFGLGEGESSPVYRQPVLCGKEGDLSWYRTAAHNAWYEWFAQISLCGLKNGKSVLDVGAGMCEGMKILSKYSPDVRGIEVDERLLRLDSRLSTDPLNGIKDNSVDVITCVDVIEHVVKDIELMDNMKRIARDSIYITTPCYLRSECGNIAHCREYSIPQFMNFFKPTEIWSASPDGSVHLTKVLSRKDNIIHNHSDEGPDNKIEATGQYYKDYVPITTKFNKTVDGEEWAHIAACFYSTKGIF